MTFLHRKRLRDARYTRGQCVHCSRPRVATSSRCVECLQKKVAAYYAKKRAGKGARKS